MKLISCWMQFLASGKRLVSVSRCCWDHVIMIVSSVTEETFPWNSGSQPVIQDHQHHFGVS